MTRKEKNDYLKDLSRMTRPKLTNLAQKVGIKSPQNFLLPELRTYVKSALERVGTSG